MRALTGYFSSPRLPRVVRHWRADRRANVSVLMAFVVTAVLGLAGVALDLEFTVRQKNKVQFALDSAVLAGALDRQKG
ncbi:MAG: hypothetical protein KDA43_07775, partial [Hyphomonas sp.]|nr:hypothetical protein [Hyphomonas sp.]